MKSKYHFVKIMCVILVVISASVLVVLNGCSNENVTSEKTEQTNQSEETTIRAEIVSKNTDKTSDGIIPNSNFERISENESVFTYYRDKATDVVYVCYDEYDSGGLIELTDPKTGLPLTYENYRELLGYK